MRKEFSVSTESPKPKSHIWHTIVKELCDQAEQRNHGYLSVNHTSNFHPHWYLHGRHHTTHYTLLTNFNGIDVHVNSNYVSSQTTIPYDDPNLFQNIWNYIEK